MAKASWLGLGKRRKGQEPQAPPQVHDAQQTAPQEDPAQPESSETERERQLHGLAVLSLFLHSTATIEETMNMLLEQAPTVTSAVFVYPLLLDRKRQLLRGSVLEGCTDSRLERAMDAFQEDLTALEFSLVDNQGLSRTLQDGEVSMRRSFAVLMQGVLEQERWEAAEKALGVRKLALVPMIVESEPLGIVVFAFDQDEVDVEALELLVGHLTLALRDLLVRDEATRFSDIDPVTWVHNRRYITETLENEMARANRYGRGLSLVLLDIDNFSRFNAEYGQSMGDRLLRAVGTTLAESLSPPEVVARLKDDDFAILLPETNRAAAVATVSRLLDSLSGVSVFTGEDDTPPVTASVAIVAFPEDGSTTHVLFGRATADLEIAKREREEEERGEEERRLVDPVARVVARQQEGEALQADPAREG